MNILMHDSGVLDEKSTEFFEDDKNNGKLHRRHKKEFTLPKEIGKSKYPFQTLNDILRKESWFTFSFVRHPYRR